MSSLKNFYSSSYKRGSDQNVLIDHLRNVNIPKLSYDARTSCEGKLTLNECWKALKSMGSSKSPRNDGQSKEFCIC